MCRQRGAQAHGVAGCETLWLLFWPKAQVWYPIIMVCVFDLHRLQSQIHPMECSLMHVAYALCVCMHASLHACEPVRTCCACCDAVKMCWGNLCVFQSLHTPVSLSVSSLIPHLTCLPLTSSLHFLSAITKKHLLNSNMQLYKMKIVVSNHKVMLKFFYSFFQYLQITFVIC